MNYDLLELSRGESVDSAVVGGHPRVSASYAVSPGRYCVQEKHSRPTAGVRMEAQYVHFVQFKNALPPFLPRKVRLKGAQCVWQVEVVWEDLDSIAPRYGDRPRKPTIVAHCLLQNPLRIDVYSLKQVPHSLFWFHCWENRIHRLPVMERNDRLKWMRGQESEHTPTNIHLLFSFIRRDHVRNK